MEAAAASNCSLVETHLAVTLLYKVLHKNNRFSVSSQRLTNIPKGQYYLISNLGCHRYILITEEFHREHEAVNSILNMLYIKIKKFHLNVSMLFEATIRQET